MLSGNGDDIWQHDKGSLGKSKRTVKKMNAISSTASSIYKRTKEIASEVTHKVGTSHSAFTNTVYAAAVVTTSLPKLSLEFIINSVEATLPEPRETKPCSMDYEKLKFVRLCTILATQVYQKPEKRKLPTSVGSIVYELTSAALKVPFFIANSEELNIIFLVLRGSYCFNDFLTDLQANAAVLSDGLVHQGMFRSAISVHTHAKDIVLQLSRENNNRPIVLTGHSLGAGVAAVVTEMLREDVPDLDITCTIIAPPAILSKNLSIRYKQFCTSFCMECDPVPFMSFHNFAQLSNQLPKSFSDFFEPIMQRKMKSSGKEFPIIPHDANPFQEPAPPLESILNQELQNINQSTALYPPGNLYVFQLRGKMFLRVQLRETDCEYFGHLVKGLNEKRHINSNYFECIDELCKIMNPDEEEIEKPDPIEIEEEEKESEETLNLE